MAFLSGDTPRSCTRSPSPLTGTIAALLTLAAASLLGCASTPRFSLEPDEAAAYAPFAPPREIRVLTINVWSGLTYDGALEMGRHPDDLQQRRKALLKEIRELAPDIIAIQEANPLPDYAERLATDLDYRVVYRVALGGVRLGRCGIPLNLREGDAILVKRPWTVVDLGTKRLGGRGIASNWFCCHLADITQALLCRAVVNGKPLYVYNVHLKSGPCAGATLDAGLAYVARTMSPGAVCDARKGVQRRIDRRRREILALKDFIEATLPEGMPAIVLGDFNTSVESGELDPLLGDGQWLDAYRLSNPKSRGATWDPDGNPNYRQSKPTPDPYGALCAYSNSRPRRIDFILLRGNIPRDRVVGSRVVMTAANGVCPSDHYGVLTTLRW